jgi:LmbE family N-acetylglucosaminyl deacetylase
MPTDSFPERTTLVMAHPDDEVLWAGSVLARLERVVLCFSDVPSNPGWSEGRTRSMKDYPLANATNLGLVESEVFEGAAWLAPVETSAGLAVARGERATQGYSETRYQDNHSLLLERLRPILERSPSVLTHSPWGEYGHEEHVQVFRAVADLQVELGFELWVPGYVSEKSYRLMLRHIPRLQLDPVSCPTDPVLSREIMALYSRNGCWTWFNDYVWPERDHFYRWVGSGGESAGLSPGRLVPMNMLWTNWRPSPPPRRALRRLGRHARRLLNL